MIPELAQYSLIIAFCLALIQAIVPLWGSYYNQNYLINLAKPMAYGQALFISLSFLSLAYLLVSNDFTVAYVAQNSNTHLPPIYRFCATWGAHEGSLLLWVLILSFWGAAVATFQTTLDPKMKARVLSIMAMVSIGFLLFLLMTSNPFARVFTNVVQEGRDLNPLLQDPGLIIHPPVLYLGYVGFCVAFAFAMTALISDRFDSQWARLARPWTLLAFSFLTGGIILGSWWAYRVLGWGGWWFWDPVENASFLPWLSGTALVHSLIVAEKRDAFKAWTLLLSIMTFSLSLMGTFLVRSGVLVSVHTFAVDPVRGAFILYFLALMVGGSLFIYAWRGHKIENSGVFHLWSRETLLLSNNVILVSAMLTVLLGTLYPLIIETLGLGKLSVGPPYFNSVFIPLMIPLLFIMGFGPALKWQQGQYYLIVDRFKYTLLISFVLAVLLPFIFTSHFNVSVLLGLALAFWVIIATLQNSFTKSPTRVIAIRWGMMLAHTGFAVCVMGVVITSTFSQQRDVRMLPGDSLTIKDYLIKFEGVTTLAGPNYTAFLGTFSVRQGHQIQTLHPQLRIYAQQKMSVPKAAIQITPFHDLYLALGEQLDKGAWSLRIYYKPFVRWIWAGGLLILLGGMVAVYQLKKQSLNRLN